MESETAAGNPLVVDFGGRQIADEKSGLTHELRDEPAMQRLPQHAFAAILTLDDKHRSEHLRVLEAYLSSPTNRSQAATRCHLSRTVFYQRLAALETILGMDLNDAKTLTLLTLALTVYRQSQM
ncbi:helix-turn-helix domain-containing protein [Glutamicibacter ardleyensis]|uniref:helix-turn-helix domain-containing protein n=1 Tax=Glutamicibacter ardleyensis TaxID=225894 RepID=UPI003FD1AAC9